MRVCPPKIPLLNIISYLDKGSEEYKEQFILRVQKPRRMFAIL